MRKRVYRRRPRRKAPKRKVTKVVKQYVARAIRRNVENKVVQYSGTYQVGNILNSSTLQALPLAPYSTYMNLVQGFSQDTRVGNRVRPTKVMFNYTLRANPFDGTSNLSPRPCYVQLFFGYVKSQKAVLPPAGAYGGLYQNGASQIGPQGNLTDLVRPINTDFWKIHKIVTHKIGNASVSGTGGLASYEYFSNNDFKISAFKRMNVTRFLPKQFIFNDGASSTVQNGNCFVFMQAVAADGITISGSQLPVTLDWQIVCEYEDA